MRVHRPVNLTEILVACGLVIASGTAPPSLASAQEPEAAAVSDSVEDSALSPVNLLFAAKEIMEAAEICALITVDSDGTPHARAMDPFAPESDMKIWFGTNPASRKVEHIRRDPRVTLYYWDKATISYVTLHGTARLVEDPAEKAARWKDDWAVFYPDRDESYMLIEVTPNRIEVVSPPRQILGESATWEVPAVDLGDG